MYVIIIQYSFLIVVKLISCVQFSQLRMKIIILMEKNFPIYDIIMLYIKNEYMIVYSINRRVSQN